MNNNYLKPFLIWAGGSAIIGVVLGLVTIFVVDSNYSKVRHAVIDEIEEAAEETVELEEANIYSGGAFRASLSGSIGNARLLSFEISYDPDSYPTVTGTDSYSTGNYIDLEGSYDPESEELNLTETYNGDITGNITGTLSINRATGSVTYRGNFVNYRGNSYDFVLHGKLQ